MQPWEKDCSDTLKFLPGSIDDKTIVIDKRFNSFVSIIYTDVSYLALTFTTCRPTSKIKRIGNGFKAFVTTQGMYKYERQKVVKLAVKFKIILYTKIEC